MLTNRVQILLFALVALSFSAPAFAGTCVDGGCHSDKVGFKFLHGPLAAEELGMSGCNTCHVQDGAPCSKDNGGVYKFAANEDALCTSCHEKSTATDHLTRNDECLECHSPHGSDDDPTLQR